LNLFGERVDFFRSELAGKFGHVAFAVGDDIAQIIGGSGGGFCGDESGPAKMTAPGGFSMTLGAVFQINRVASKPVSAGGVWAEADARARYETAMVAESRSSFKGILVLENQTEQYRCGNAWKGLSLAAVLR